MQRVYSLIVDNNPGVLSRIAGLFSRRGYSIDSITAGVTADPRLDVYKRQVKDYLVYVLTMTFVTALMFAFNSILFSRDVQELFEVAGLMAAMVGIATFFIVLIVAWLINYMIRFMLEKRSQEFGIYLLLGMKKKKIASLYMRENLLMGTGADVYKRQVQRRAIDFGLKEIKDE